MRRGHNVENPGPTNPTDDCGKHCLKDSGEGWKSAWTLHAFSALSMGISRMSSPFADAAFGLFVCDLNFGEQGFRIPQRIQRNTPSWQQGSWEVHDNTSAWIVFASTLLGTHGPGNSEFYLCGFQLQCTMCNLSLEIFRVGSLDWNVSFILFSFALQEHSTIFYAINN